MSETMRVFETMMTTTEYTMPDRYWNSSKEFEIIQADTLNDLLARMAQYKTGEIQKDGYGDHSTITFSSIREIDIIREIDDTDALLEGVESWRSHKEWLRKREDAKQREIDAQKALQAAATEKREREQLALLQKKWGSAS